MVDSHIETWPVCNTLFSQGQYLEPCVLTPNALHKARAVLDHPFYLWVTESRVESDPGHLQGKQ